MHGGLGDAQHRHVDQVAHLVEPGIAEAGHHVGVGPGDVGPGGGLPDFVEKAWYTTPFVVVVLDAGRPDGG